LLASSGWRFARLAADCTIATSTISGTDAILDRFGLDIAAPDEA